MIQNVLGHVQGGGAGMAVLRGKCEARLVYWGHGIGWDLFGVYVCMDVYICTVLGVTMVYRKIRCGKQAGRRG
jgi:hypothetical protein